VVGPVALETAWQMVHRAHAYARSVGIAVTATVVDEAGAPIAVLLVVWIISWIIAPLVTQLLALAVSRKREYLADAMSAQFTRNPLALASALQKIENAEAPTTAIKRGSAHLCIADPLGRRLTSREGWLADRLASHPPMSMRISRLKGMGYAQIKKEQGTLPDAP